MRVQNKASVAYYLMFDNQMRMKSGAYLREELSEASDAAMQHPSGAPLSRGPARCSRCQRTIKPAPVARRLWNLH